jgi:VanZ family protein
MNPQRSSATGLAWVYAALVVYASLYPFDGWRWPPGQALSALLALPRAVHQSTFDIVSNFGGYLPLGLFVALAALRSGWRLRHAALLTLVLTALLSWSCEVLQHFVPGRVPTREDLLFNLAGAAAGALLALAMQALGLVERWNRLRQRWFAGDAAVALVLLVLWPVALLFPAPVPLGLGQLGEPLRELALAATADVAWAEGVHDWLDAPAPPGQPLRPLGEALLIALGLLAPSLVAFSVVAPGWRRVVLSLGATVLAAATVTLSTALNFGPQHALAWLGPAVVPGLAVGTGLAVLAAALPRRLVAGVGLVVLTALVAGVAQAPEDPYFSQSLLAWEQGRFVRFHGLAQWIGWLWPYAAMLWLLSRLGATPGRH